MTDAELGTVRLLVLEDQPDDFALVRRELERDGILLDALRVGNAHELERALLEHDWDLIISDFNLPQLNAFGALRIVREARPDTPFVVVSGSIGEEQAVELMRAGATDYLMKDRLARLPAVLRREVAMARARQEQRKLERQLLQLQKIESLGTLAGGVAHNFRNVLMAINGLGELVADQIGREHPAWQDLSDLRAAAKRSEQLVDRIMSFARRNDDAPPRRVDMNQCVRDALAMLRPTLPRTIELKVGTHEGECVCLGHQHELEQALVNLCTNAAHALDGRPGRIEISCEQVLVGEQSGTVPLAPGCYSVLAVSDNGVGMTPEVRARIFEPFFTTKPEGVGTGLGLPMVHSVVTAMGGGVECSSQLGHGTTFRLYLPSPEQRAPRSTVRVRPAAQPQGRGQHVMVVDDEQTIVNLTAALLNQGGYRVSKFYDPTSALNAFHADPLAYDLLFSDLAMPGMTGVELSRAMRKVRPGFPVILSSGYPAEPDSPLLEDCDCLLSKPSSRQDIYDAVESLLCAEVGRA